MDYWHKQDSAKPLYAELLWSRPENKRQAGKLLIVGGNLHGFAAPAEAYQAAVKAGIGTARVLLPNALQKVVGPIIDNGEFAASTPSGSFSQKALAELLDLSVWADGVLLAGDLGRNSETAILLEKFVEKYRGQLTFTKDAVDYFGHLPTTTWQRPATLFVLTVAQLQWLLKSLNYPKAVRFGMDLLALVDLLHELTTEFPIQVIVKHGQNLVVAVSGQVSTTKVDREMPIWRIKTAATATVWWLQNPAKPFEALTTAIHELAE